MTDDLHDGTVKINPAELRVLARLAAGDTYQEAAHSLGITTCAAQKRGARGARKLGARSTTHAVAILVRRGIVPVAE